MTLWDDAVVCHSTALACIYIYMISGSGWRWRWSEGEFIQRRLGSVCVLLRHYSMHAVHTEKIQETTRYAPKIST